MSYMYSDIDGLEGAERSEQAMCSVVAAQYNAAIYLPLEKRQLVFGNSVVSKGPAIATLLM